LKRAAFRADASREMGTGHVMRCLTLADDLRRRGWDTVFLGKEFPGNLNRRVRESGHSVIALPAPEVSVPGTAGAHAPAHAAWLHGPWSADAEACVEGLGRVGPVDWLVVDHYSLDAQWERSMRMAASRILSLDDLADRDHDCDVLLDQNLRLDHGSAYAGRVPAACVKLLGPRYALLRPEFRAERARLQPRAPDVAKVLVFLGGADPDNFTGKVLEALDSPGLGELEWHVVVGKTNPSADALAGKWAGRPKVIFHRDVREMGRLIATADLAVAGGGISTWERPGLALPTLALSIAFNQEGLLEAADRAGLVAYAGRASELAAADLASRISALVRDPARRAGMAALGMDAVDGLGVERVAERMVSS